MIRRALSYRVIFLSSFLALIAVRHGYAQLQPSKMPSLNVSAYPSVKAVQPGQPFEVAIRMDIESGWHTYWKNSGDSGLPPAVDWQLPDGFQVSDLRHPAPHRHEDASGLVTYIHEGRPILTVTITPPSTIQQPNVRVKGLLTVLVCKQACVMLDRDFEFALPVAEPGSGVQLDNQAVFEEAAFARPRPVAESQFVKFQPSISAERIEPGQPFEFLLTLEVSKGHHIQSNRPLQASLIATEVFLEPTRGVTFGEAQFPKHKIRKLPNGTDVAEFEGQTDIKFSATSDAELPPGPVRIAGVTRLQVCNDRGQCFRPEVLAWELLSNQDGQIPVVVDTDASAVVETSTADDVGDGKGLVWYMMLAALGGLILNVMPCVLPVISIKVLSFVQQADEDPGRVFKLGIVFAMGILASFLALALLVVVLQQAGQTVGWGFQLSKPIPVILLSTVIFVFALSLFGVFEVNLPGTANAKLGGAIEREGAVGTFFKGLLATVLGTPCVGPFLGPTIGWTFGQPPVTIMLVFLSMGLGMSLPYVLLTARPAWMKYLPKPGAWMETFKQFMGFVLLGTVAWFLLTLGNLIGPDGLVWTLVFFCIVAMSCWVVGQINFQMSTAQQLRRWAVAVGLSIGGWAFTYGYAFDVHADWRESYFLAGANHAADYDRLDYTKEIPWQRWEENIGERLAAQGYTVFIDYTATWCPNCQSNKKVAVETQAVREKMRAFGVIPIMADYTAQPPAMTEELQRYGRSAVPYNVVFPANRPHDRIELPEILIGEDIVLDALGEAGPSQRAAEALARQDAL